MVNGRKNLDKQILPREFYQQTDVVRLAKELIGKWLMTSIDGHLTGGMIIETEAYKGTEDKACHAFNGCRTKRTEVMYASGGVAYVYLCYGMHSLFNVVVNSENIPEAILIRAIAPDTGLDIMKVRRGGKEPLTGGPGTVCQALGIDRTFSGHILTDWPLWIEDRGIKPGEIKATPRIGVAYAKEHALLPWRFLLK